MTSNHNSEKIKLLSFFKASQMPKEKINTGCLQHRELLFSDKPTIPELINSKEKNLKQYYINSKIEDTEDRSKTTRSTSDTFNFNNTDNLSASSAKTPKETKTVWKRGGVDVKENSNNSQKTNEGNDVNNNKEFTRNQETVGSNISKKSNTSGNAKIMNQGEEKVEYKPEILHHVEHFMGNEVDNDKTEVNSNNNQFPINSMPCGYRQNEYMQAFPQNQSFMNNNHLFINFVSIKTEYILQICQYLKYSLEDPLWYIFHPMANSTFGPLNSKHIVDMCNMKMINGLTDIRLIDVFNIKNYKPFTFFKLKDIEREGFLDCIEDSTVVASSSLYKNHEKIKEMLKAKTQENEKLTEKLASLQLETNLLKEINKYKENEKPKEDLTFSKNVEKNNNKKKEIFNTEIVPESNIRSFVDEDDDDEENNDKSKSKSQLNNNNQKKMKKGGMPESDEWEISSKKKRPGKNSNSKGNDQIFLSSIKTPTNLNLQAAKEKEKLMFSNKVDLVRGDDLVELLKPAKNNNVEYYHEPEKITITTPTINTASANTSNTRSKKSKARPVELNVKLGFNQYESTENTFKVVGANKKK